MKKIMMLLACALLMVGTGCAKKQTSESADANDNPTYTIKKVDATLSGAQAWEKILGNYKGKVVLIDFWATWCGPCRMQAPILEELDEQLNGKVKICKLDVDDEPAIAQRFGVMSIPTVVLFENGQEKNRSVGLVPKEKLLALLGR